MTYIKNWVNILSDKNLSGKLQYWSSNLEVNQYRVKIENNIANKASKSNKSVVKIL